MEDAKLIDPTLAAKLNSLAPDPIGIDDAPVVQTTATGRDNTEKDGELARGLATRDPNALAEVYDLYAASLYRMLQALLSSPADAEDALQEVFVRIATGRISRIRDLRAYLFGAARHEAFRILRHRKRESPLSESALDDCCFPANTIGNTLSCESANQSHEWAALLARLPVEQREVIALKVWEQMTFVEIARIVRVSPNTVMSRYRYGIERLRLWCREEESR